MRRFFTFFLFVFLSFTLMAQIPVFPGAEGFGTTTTTGGRGGTVYYVTNLNCNGPGSLNDALQQPGPKYILFTVSGIIDCAAEILWGDVYIAGQTSPGGIIVRGILMDDYYEPAGKAQNILIRHLNSRPSTGEVRPGSGYILDDALRIDGAQRVVIDHCSMANATDECVQISRSSQVTIMNSILAETLGEHYYLGGMLLNYSTAAHPKDSISIHHNTWNRIGGRMPEISCEESGETPGDMTCLTRPFKFEFSDNLLWDIPIQVYYTQGFNPSQPNAFHDVYANFVNNRAVARNSYCGPFFDFILLNNDGNQFYTTGNTMNQYPSYADYELFYCCNDFCLYNPNTDPGVATHKSSAFNYPPITYTPGTDLPTYIVANAGAFNGYSPAARDPMNRRLLLPIQNGTPDSQPVNGTDYFNDAFVLDFSTPPDPPVDTDLDGMPDDWELAHGLNPNVQDHNGTGLSVPLTGIAGYTNLECYLNELSDNLVDGNTTLATELFNFEAIPLAASQKVLLRWVAENDNMDDRFQVERSTDGFHFSLLGEVPVKRLQQVCHYELMDKNPPAGVLYYRLLLKNHLNTPQVIKLISCRLVGKNNWLKISSQSGGKILEIQVQDEMWLPVNLNLYNVAGQHLRSAVLQSGSGHLNVGDFPPGIYLLEVSNALLRDTIKLRIGF